MRDIGIVSGYHANIDSPNVFEFWVTNILRGVPMQFFFRFNRENKRYQRAKANFRCLNWFPAAMLESLRQAKTWRLHTKHYYNFQWYPLPNNSSSEYRTSPKLWHVGCFLLFIDISIIDSFYWMVSVIIKLSYVMWKSPIFILRTKIVGLDWFLSKEDCEPWLRRALVGL